MFCRGVRGAITVDKNDREEIISATKELLRELVRANDIKIEDIACVIFTTTKDLNAEFPARAARELGWNNTALLCSTEIDVPGSLPRCIRVLILYNTDREEVKHVYLREAKKLRG